MKLKKEFADFYSGIRIDSESNMLREKRSIIQDDIESKLPGIMESHDVALNKTDIRMIDQGSYKYSTTIKSNVVDRDVAVIIPLKNHNDYDPRTVKGCLKDAISIPSRTVSIKEPCVRAAYYENGEEWLHIDLPLYVEDAGNVYLARGKATSSNYSWEIADPDGLNEYLCSKINGNAQLRRVICYLKKWKNEKYASSISEHEVPPSIALTLLACDCFSSQTGNDGDDDLQSLQMTAQAIKNKFIVSYDANGDVVSAKIDCILPVAPYCDVFQKMKSASDSYLTKFYKRLATAVDWLTNAINVESEHDAAVYVQKVLGTDFVVPAKAAETANTQSKREHSFG